MKQLSSLVEKMRREICFSDIFVFFILFILFSYKLIESYNFDSDFGRDLMWMYDIAHGKITLLGPKLSFGGYYLGPYYYYLFVPFLALTGFMPDGVLLGNAFLFALISACGFFLLRKKFGKISSFLSVLIFAVSGFYLYSARSPGNAFSYLPFLFVFSLIILFYPNLLKKRLVGFLLGFTAGFILNFHPVAIIFIAPFVLFSLFFNWRLWKKTFLFFILGGFISFLPTLVFELRHNFVMFKNTFIEKSYQFFATGSSPASITQPSKNPFENLFVIDRLSKDWISLSVVFILFISFLIFLFGKKEKQVRIVFFSLLATFILYSFLLRFQVAIHYLFPLYFVGVLSIVIGSLYLSPRFLRFLVLFTFVVVGLYRFPKWAYSESIRSFKSMYEDVKALQGRIPKDNFNIVVIRETPLAILGYEYRYMLRTLGYRSDDEFSYAKSRYLIVVSEKGEIKVSEYKSWELEEFGRKELVDVIRGKRNVFYVFKKL